MIRALVVEDSENVAERVVEMLSLAGMEVLKSVATEDSALEIVERQRIDFAVIDLQLAQGTGFGVIRALSQRRPLPCIVVLTNHAVPALKAASFEAGADYVLDKQAALPCMLSKLVAGFTQLRRAGEST